MDIPPVTARSVFGQTVTFGDESTLSIPMDLTCWRDESDEAGWWLKIDSSGKKKQVPEPVTRSRMVTYCNVLLIQKWRDDGKPGDGAKRITA